MYLSLPLLSTMTRTMAVTIFSTDGTTPPKPHTITVPKQRKCKDLVKDVSIACPLRNDEKILMAEIYNHKIIRFLEDPFDPLSPIRDYQHLATYKLCQEESPLLEFMHHWKEEDYFSTQSTGYWKPFGTPLITRLQDDVHTGVDLQAKFQTLLAPLLQTKSLPSFTKMNIAKENDHKVEAGEDVMIGDLNDQLSISNDTLGDDFESLLNDNEKTIPNGHSGCPLPSELSFQLSLTDKRGTKKDGFFRRLFWKKSEDYERRDGQDKGEDDDKGSTSWDKDEGSYFLSFRRIFRIHPKDEKTLSTSIENCYLSTPENSPGTDIVF